jgi:murein DD-endopeptidase MepM/ murein hydrolase activator NlpD
MMRGSLLLALLATACASGQAAPIAYGGGAQPAPVYTRPPPAPAIEEEPARTPAVQEEAPNWADGEGTPLSSYALQPNEAQPFDPAHLPRTHRVRENESLYDIATTYQVPLRALIDQNRLEPPYALRPGSDLQLPPPRFHTVARGESFEDIARRYNVDPRSLALLNRMQAPYRVRQGDRIVLPAMARAYGAPASPPAETVAAPENAGGTPALHNARFAWPLRGQLVTRYGAHPNGARIDGVEIAGREGAEIAAAAEGDVVYAGSDLAAYGTLVLVRHADNYVTAYGHARRALVREGQHVRAGEAIAELGPRSDGRPRLLFQVRRGAEAIDPTPLLGP